MCYCLARSSEIFYFDAAARARPCSSSEIRAARSGHVDTLSPKTAKTVMCLRHDTAKKNQKERKRFSTLTVQFQRLLNLCKNAPDIGRIGGSLTAKIVAPRRSRTFSRLQNNSTLRPNAVGARLLQRLLYSRPPNSGISGTPGFRQM
jgi:hypothetical protein